MELSNQIKYKEMPEQVNRNADCPTAAMAISFFLYFLFLLLPLQGSALDVSSITPLEMRISTVEELKEAPSDLAAALKNYHKTRKYKQTPREFFLDPDSYMLKRIEALEALQKTIPGDPKFDSLRRQIECKLAYLKALPDITDSRVTRRELKYARMAALGVEMSEAYCFEFLDPLHRIGPEVKVYIDSWLCSGIPNYFIYLETVEYDPLMNQFCPFKNQVKYYTASAQREPHRLSFRDRIAYLNNLPFDTGRSLSLHTEGEGIAIFTVGLDEEIYVNSHIKYRIHHSSEFAGGPVIGAGELKASEGRITHISNKSGHYSPKHKETMNMLEVLYNKLGDLSDIELEMIQYTKSNQKYFKQTATFNAQEYLENEGKCPALHATGDWTPLHVAVWNNHIELMSRTLDQNDINKKDFQGNTPLHLAIIQGHVEWVERLLDNGANAEAKNTKGNTPLHLAALYGLDDIVSLLLEEVKDIDINNNLNQTPLHLAALGGSSKAFNTLLNSGADIDHKDKWGNSLFHFAVFSGNTEFLIDLLDGDYARKVFLKNHRGATALHLAAAFGDMMTVQITMSLGFDPLETDNKGRTALHYSTKFGNEQTTQLFLNMKSQELIHAKCHSQKSALHYAAKTLPHEILQQLIAHGMRVNSIDSLGRTPLYYTIDGRSAMSLRNLMFLLENGGNTQITDYNGQALIHYAASKGAISAIRRILTKSNDLKLKDRNGRTPLEIAQSKNYEKMKKYILDHTLD